MENTDTDNQASGVHLDAPLKNEGVFAYIQRTDGKFTLTRYRQIIGAANAFKEGDAIQGIAADSDTTRNNARTLLTHTRIGDIIQTPLFHDDILALIQQTTAPHADLESWTFGELKNFLLLESESRIKALMPSLSSDSVACVVKLMTNAELIRMGKKIFNPLPNSQIGSKGYMGARVQPNSPTDHPEDIVWQVFDAWAYAVGDVVLGTNPVSSDPRSVSAIARALHDILTTFGLENTLPNCVLSHIDIQAEAEAMYPGTTGIWFQSLAGTTNANQTFNIGIDKMRHYARQRTGKYGLYAETGQGADATNGHGEGFDMVVHESRKYGFLRALKADMAKGKTAQTAPWVFVNNVAGFIGPEVFRTRDQLVRCCLEDIAMGKLHGHTIGLDICSTLHMDVTLDDLDWCISEIMPANPAYLMALPTKNDPMLSYLTTAFQDHVRIREQFGYKVNDAMWAFFKKIGIIGKNNHPTSHFGDPVFVYYQYCKAKQDPRSQAEIYAEGMACLRRIRERGVSIAEGYGAHHWELNPELAQEVRYLYDDAKVSLWTDMPMTFIETLPAATAIFTTSHDRTDYIYHPESGEHLSEAALQCLTHLRNTWGRCPDIQIIVSDGLNAKALMDDGHLSAFLNPLIHALQAVGFSVSTNTIVITHGRVRAGYACGEILFGHPCETDVSRLSDARKRAIIHIIGERPGSVHHNFSAYITVASTDKWAQAGLVDHDISCVVSGISDTALSPTSGVNEVVALCQKSMKF